MTAYIHHLPLGLLLILKHLHLRQANLRMKMGTLQHLLMQRLHGMYIGIWIFISCFAYPERWCNWWFFRPMHEITFSTDDKPKLLSQVVDNLLILTHYILYGFYLRVFLWTDLVKFSALEVKTRPSEMKDAAKKLFFIDDDSFMEDGALSTFILSSYWSGRFCDAFGVAIFQCTL